MELTISPAENALVFACWKSALWMCPSAAVPNPF